MTKQLTRISSQEMSAAFEWARRENLLDDADTAVMFYDLSRLQARVKKLSDVFPDNTLHAVAVKTNPFTSILKLLKQWGTGVEVASFGEVYLVEKAGFSPANIVFDSPVKTIEELDYALRRGFHINADSFEELSRIHRILTDIGKTNSAIGIRINPQIGEGANQAMSVAGQYSKFGISLDTHYAELMAALKHYPWLNGVHLHIGSQTCPPAMLVKGIRKTLDFINEANAALTSQQRAVQSLDIGGGLPVAYSDSDPAWDMGEYWELIQAECPELKHGKFRLITEFGRYLYANAGWVASRVEYVKPEADVYTLIHHVGADMFLRESYQPEHWHHDISIADDQGRLKTKDARDYAIGGPLCFGGDMLEKCISLPTVEAGDYLFIHDVGANTINLWSRHNSRQMPKMIGYDTNAKKIEILKRRETLEDIYQFWS